MLSPKDLSMIARKVSQTLWAMSKGQKDGRDLAGTMREERYQRTMTDEYPFSKKPRAGFSPVPEEQKEVWRKLNERKP